MTSSSDWRSSVSSHGAPTSSASSKLRVMSDKKKMVEGYSRAQNMWYLAYAGVVVASMPNAWTMSSWALSTRRLVTIAATTA